MINKSLRFILAVFNQESGFIYSANIVLNSEYENPDEIFNDAEIQLKKYLTSSEISDVETWQDVQELTGFSTNNKYYQIGFADEDFTQFDVHVLHNPSIE